MEKGKVLKGAVAPDHPKKPVVLTNVPCHQRKYVVLLRNSGLDQHRILIGWVAIAL